MPSKPAYEWNLTDCPVGSRVTYEVKEGSITDGLHDVWIVGEFKGQMVVGWTYHADNVGIVGDGLSRRRIVSVVLDEAENSNAAIAAAAVEVARAEHALGVAIKQIPNDDPCGFQLGSPAGVAEDRVSAARAVLDDLTTEAILTEGMKDV
jgi:hypothetical protein